MLLGLESEEASTIVVGEAANRHELAGLVAPGAVLERHECNGVRTAQEQVDDRLAMGRRTQHLPALGLGRAHLVRLRRGAGMAKQPQRKSA